MDDAKSDGTLRGVMSYLWIGFGSALGGMGRYWCSGVTARVFGEAFPWGTILVNVVGSLIIGFVATLMPPDGRILSSPDARDFLLVGVLGGYTTFSAFSLQTLGLARDGQWAWALVNVVASVVLCLTAVWLGHLGAAALSR